MPQKGFANKNKIFSIEQEDAIKDDFMGGDKSVTAASLSRQYGVSENTIARAIERSFQRQGERTKMRFQDGA